MRTDPLAYLGDQLEDLKTQGLYRSLRILDGEAKATSVYDGKSVVNLSSNNYLGLTTHPKLKQKAIEAIEQFGVGSGAVRSISGTMAMHMELERRLAEFKHTEAVVVFQSGFSSNAGTVSAILTREDAIISDELNHASIIDGARLSRATIKVYPHGDADAARKILSELPPSQRKLLITDGVFSMDGDLGPLPALDAKPLWKTTTASVCLNSASRRSSSMCIAMVPEMLRTAPDPTPNRSTASMAFCLSRGWVVRPR